MIKKNYYVKSMAESNVDAISVDSHNTTPKTKGKNSK